jgi:hypothetical protein
MAETEASGWFEGDRARGVINGSGPRGRGVNVKWRWGWGVNVMLRQHASGTLLPMERGGVQEIVDLGVIMKECEKWTVEGWGW